ncbi:RelA/SpoT domain-containing protein [Stenotrophomonas sp. TWI1151]|jgi:ppGpp synthetase/RelA/SpoT-type nucleotidyltranferase|uniref:RelA/SpoT domain-containing protein n=1 Tax=Stenotrophomonas sp. TWI1151 TaxID=3136798 RepID=UPI00320924D8
MPLTDPQIEQCHDRYLREVDRYAKMADLVYNRCIDIVQKKLTIRATVQRRVKSPSSFVEKLRRPDIRAKFDTVEAVFAGVSDLAAVRVATYLESDRGAVVEEIESAFFGANADEPKVEKKDDPQKNYKATHCQVYLGEGDLTNGNENLVDTTCEVQVCSLLAHVFNEIEHDLVYKPLNGTLSDAENELIDQLSLITRAGDLTIRRLLAETDERHKDSKGRFQDVFDFVARMRTLLGNEVRFSNNAGQLFEELQGLNVHSPEDVDRVVAHSGLTLEQASKNEFDKLKAFLDGNDRGIALEEGTSDVLLAGVLRTHADQVLDRHPTGRGKGRPMRLVQIAKAYKQMIEQPAVAPNPGAVAEAVVTENG